MHIRAIDTTWWTAALRRLRAQSRSARPHATLQPPSHDSLEPLSFPLAASGRTIRIPKSFSVCYYPGKVHGGLLASILDEEFAELCQPAVTAKLTLNYRASVSPGAKLIVATQVYRMEGRKIWVHGVISSVEDGTIYVEGEALFVRIAS